MPLPEATAVILALNELYELQLSEEELVAAAAMIGSDTAFFVRNTPQLCTGRGEKMEPIELPLQGKYLVYDLGCGECCGVAIVREMQPVGIAHNAELADGALDRLQNIGVG